MPYYSPSLYTDGNRPLRILGDYKLQQSNKSFWGCFYLYQRCP